jgi:hypothetical protein
MLDMIRPIGPFLNTPDSARDARVELCEFDR